MRKLLMGIIRFYQLAISPVLGSNCRFYPSCSSYAREAFDRFGVLKGGYLTVLRLIKCQPLHRGGYDPVVKQTGTEQQTTCGDNCTE